MFIGHFGLGFGAKRLVPAVSLGALFLAAQFADLLWPSLVLAGAERVEIQPGATAVTPLDFVSYPYSHSLLMLVVWGVLVAAVYRLAIRSPPGAAVVLAALVVSHWVLDVLTHRPDLPLVPGTDLRLGLGLWNSLAGTLLVELPLFAAGLALYVRATRPSDRTGWLALYGLVVFLLVVYAANLFGPVPPGSGAVVWSAQAMWLLIAWGFWIDRHRRPAVIP
jgi:hypothetical protein